MIAVSMGTVTIAALLTPLEIRGRSLYGRFYPYRTAPVTGLVSLGNGKLPPEVGLTD